jgi:hypothetical protein
MISVDQVDGFDAVGEKVSKRIGIAQRACAAVVVHIEYLSISRMLILRFASFLSLLFLDVVALLVISASLQGSAMTSAACKNSISRFEREDERVLDDESTSI